jgi:hypothetical protein
VRFSAFFPFIRTLKGGTMKSRIFAYALALLSATAFSQVTGSGTAGTIPVWTSSTTLRNSILIQAPGPRIGLGTSSPIAKFDLLTSFSPGIRSHVLAPGNAKVAVLGISDSEAGTGLEGRASQTGSDFASVGVSGLTQGLRGIGILGQAMSPTCVDGPPTTLRGQRCVGGLFLALSPTATAGVFQSWNRGNVLIGESTDPNAILRRVFRVDGLGNVFATSFNTGGADFAEAFAPVGNKGEYEPGDVLAIAESRHVSKTSEPYSTRVLGIYSTAPGVVARPGSPEDLAARNEVPVAVMGIVPCKVTDEGGAIAPGDLLVSSSTPGYAMRGTDHSRLTGAVVGKALSALPSGRGTIEVLVMLR